jgi:hypothetical protein
MRCARCAEGEGVIPFCLYTLGPTVLGLVYSSTLFIPPKGVTSPKPDAWQADSLDVAENQKKGHPVSGGGDDLGSFT